MMISLLPASIRPLILSLTFIVVAARTLSAQGTDVRLSADVQQPVLPADAAIQSADSIGTLTLVVWGGTTAQSGGSPESVLWMQRVRDGLPLGAPELLASGTARPSGFVQVLSLADRFLVIWNDMRSGERRPYLRRVDSEGNASAEEMLDDTAPIAAGGLVAWGEREGGYDLFWNSEEGTIRARATDASTAFAAGARTVAPGSFARALRPAADPHATLLDRGESGWLIISGDEPPRTFTSDLSYYVADDGRLMTVEGNRLIEYGSLVDPQEIRSAGLPIPDTAIAGSLLIGRDGAGNPLISYAVIGQRNIGTTFTLLYLEPYAIAEVSPGVFSQPRPAGGGAQILFTTSCHTISATADSVRRERACMNRSIVSYHLRVTTTAPDGCEPPADTWSETISLVFADSLLFSPSQRYPYASYDPCDVLPSIRVLRLPSDSGSAVAFVHDSAVVRLSAPVAMRSANLPETDPVLAYQENALMVGWRTSGTIPSATAGLWNPAAGSMEELGRGPLATLSDASIRMLSGALRWGSEDRSVLAGSSGGGGVLAVKAHRRGEFPEYAAEWDDNSYYRLGRSGWQAIDINNRHGAEVAASLLSLKYNPDENTTLLAVQRTSPATGFSWTQLILWDSLGNEIWRGDSVPWVQGLTPQYVPLGGSRSAVVHTGGMVLIDGTTPGRGSSDVRLRQGGYAPFIKLYGPEMAQPYERTLQGVFLEAIDTNFVITATSPALSSLEMLPDPPFDMLALLQHPLDSGLIFLYGDSDGIHMDLFSRMLVPQRTGITVSATSGFAGELSALMHGDSLFVIWKDERDGVTDIYGRALRLAGTSGVAAPGPATRLHGIRIAAAPNPAGNSVQFSWDPIPSPLQATFVITDMLGRRMAAFTAPAADGTIIWDSSLLPPGMYHVAMMAGSRHGLCKLIRQ